MSPGFKEKSFEIVVLGAGGGPLETDISGYMVKPAVSRYEDGWISLEGGCGIGALANILRTNASSHSTSGGASSQSTDNQPPFREVEYPSEYLRAKQGMREIYKAGYLFSHLSCYVITHAHLDHMSAMILSTGSLPSRQSAERPAFPTFKPGSPKRERRRSSVSSMTTLQPLALASQSDLAVRRGSVHREAGDQGRTSLVPIYASRNVLNGMQGVFAGDVWPELGMWAEDFVEDQVTTTGKDHTKAPYPRTEGVGVQYCPLPSSPAYQRLPLPLPGNAGPSVSVMHMPVSHGQTTRGMYESSAIFLRLDAPPRETQQSQLFPDGIGVDGMEFLFWGDVESALKLGGVRQSQRTEGEPYGEEVEVDLNRRVWEVAARRWIDGKLGAIFIECSYDSSRPSEFLYGHLKPLGLHAELGILASLVIAIRQDPPGTRPLEGLKICITHVKTSLIPHPSGTTDRERVFSELQALEKMAEREGSALGVQWVMCESGMRIVV